MLTRLSRFPVLNTIPFGIGTCAPSCDVSLAHVRTAGVAASTKVGNYIGARSVLGAKRASHASALLSVVAGLVVMVVLIATKDVSRFPCEILRCMLTWILGFWLSVQR